MKLDSSIAAVVTGGASGLGEATVRALAARGVRVAIFDLNTERGEEIAGEVGGVFCHADVLSDSSVDVAFAAARAAHGQERILVNCAGGGNAIKTVGRDKKTGAVTQFPIDGFTKVLMLNTVGSFRCIVRSAAGMLALDPAQDGDRGAIVCTASVAAEDGQMGQAAYSAAKAAIVGMTLPIARDLAPEGIRINTILPGIFDTPMMNAAPEAVKAALGASVPFPKRLGKPAEFASMAMELLGNSYVNGTSVRLDGAIRMAPR